MKKASLIQLECSINGPITAFPLSQPNEGSTRAHEGYKFNMKLLLLTIFMGIMATSLGKPATYTDKWDHINVDEVLSSSRLIQGYVDCLLERGRCTPDGKALKETLPDALEHECSKCTEKQKTGSDKVISHLVNKRPELWKELAAKYDPDNVYQHRYKDKIDSVKGKA